MEQESTVVAGPTEWSGLGDLSPEPLVDAAAAASFGHADVLPNESATVPRKLDRRFVTAALMLVMVLASMEQTVTSTAMPTIIGDLHGLQHYAWVASIYLLACTVSMPVYGRLADALGRKRVILVAIGLFLVASVLAASARSMPQLILWRGLQGLGAGGIMPVVLTILGDIFTLEERARIQGLFSAVWGTASLAGPALGAFLVNTLGWRSIFFVNLPFGLIAVAVLAWKYHDVEKAQSTDLDLPGAVSLTVACAALLSLVSGIGPGGWSAGACIGLLVVTLAAGGFFVRHEIGAASPIMPPKLIMRRAIGPSMLGSLLLGIAFLSLDTYVPLYVQGVLGGGATAAAGTVTPVMLTWALSGVFAAPLVVRYGFRRAAVLGSSCVVLGFSGLLVASVHTWPQSVLTGLLALTGLGFGPASMAYLLAAQDAVTWQHRGVITGGIQFFRTIGGAVGIGLMGGLFNALTQSDLNRLAGQGVSAAALLDPRGRAQLSPQTLATVSHTIGDGLMWVFVAMLGAAMLQLMTSALMSSRRSAHKVTAGEAMEAIAG
jgi:MFS family permease